MTPQNIRAKLISIKLKIARGLACQLCKERFSHRDLQWAHIKPTDLFSSGRGLIRRAYDVLKHPDCYILACEPCHRKLDKILDRI